MRSDLLALLAVVLWGSLAALGVSLSHVPPFLLTGLGLLVGSVIALPLSRFNWRAWTLPWPTLALGVYGLFGFHFLLFMALRSAPAVEANLINYLWPLGMVVLAPLVLPGLRLKLTHVLAALLGFAGAAIAIVGRNADAAFSWSGSFQIGYVYALCSAFIWSTYSLGTKRVPMFKTTAVGSFAAVSGLLALACHVAFEPATHLSVKDLGLIALLGLGPLGGAFFVWDAAIKTGDPRRIGLLAFLTPLISTVVIVWSTGQDFSVHIWLASAMIIGAAAWGRNA